MIRLTKLALALLLTIGGSGLAVAQNSGVKLGVLTDMTGPASTNTGLGSVTAAKMAVEDFGGSVLGKPIEVVQGDFLMKVDTGTLLARRWLDQDNVDAIVDVPSSPLALAIQDIVKQKKRIFLISGGTSSDLTGKACTPYTVHWHIDSYAMGNVVGQETVRRGGDKWFFLTTDTAFGHSLERDTASAVERAGGKVLGSIRFPINSQDFSSQLLRASSSGANVIALVSTSTDTSNALKQAQEFGLTAPEKNIRFVAPLGNIHDFRGAGLSGSKGIITVDGFYWDQNDQTRQWSKKFFDRMKVMPSAVHAATYSAVLHYLRAVKKAGTKDADAVIKVMKSTAVDDFFAPGGTVRSDGRLISNRLLLQVKSPQESKGDWDIYKIIREIPGNEIFRPLKDGGCPFVSN